MGIFNNLFGGGSSQNDQNSNDIDWIQLEDPTQLDVVIEKSFEKPQLVFKHSTSCIISRMALQAFTSNHKDEDLNVDMNFVNLLQFRAVSNAVAEKLNVIHESPQLILIKEGKAVQHTSHDDIGRVGLGQWL